jgi:glycosyltransferase involved in cell wall biosynthesis
MVLNILLLQYTDRVVCALIGGMSAHKGYDILKQAVLQTQPNHLCFLIVDHAKESNYQQEHFWGNVSVTFIGKIKQADIVALYQQIDVLFAPSIWPESYGLVTRESAACGCWIVASNRGGIGEDVVENENGHIIEPTEVALIDVLKKIDQNDKLYKNMPKTLPIRSVEEQVIEVLEYYK